MEPAKDVVSLARCRVLVCIRPEVTLPYHVQAMKSRCQRNAVWYCRFDAANRAACRGPDRHGVELAMNLFDLVRVPVNLRSCG